MVDISKKTFEKNDIEVIVDGIGTLWLNEKHIEETLGPKNFPVITKIYEPVYKKHIYELVNKPKKQRNRRFFRSDLALKVIIDYRTDESCNLIMKSWDLGFRLHDVINTKEHTVLKSIKYAFEGQDMQTRCSVLGYRIELYFHKHKLVIEVHELGHADRNLSNENEREEALEKWTWLCVY